jgi:hypothetical protein
VQLQELSRAIGNPLYHFTLLHLVLLAHGKGIDTVIQTTLLNLVADAFVSDSGDGVYREAMIGNATDVANVLGQVRSCQPPRFRASPLYLTDYQLCDLVLSGSDDMILVHTLRVVLSANRAQMSLSKEMLSLSSAIVHALGSAIDAANAYSLDEWDLSIDDRPDHMLTMVRLSLHCPDLLALTQAIGVEDYRSASKGYAVRGTL